MFLDRVSLLIDLYFAGHDHNLEIREPVAGVTYAISGSGGKLREMPPVEEPDVEPLYVEMVPCAIILDLDSTGWTLTGWDSADGSDVAESVTTGTW